MNNEIIKQEKAEILLEENTGIEVIDDNIVKNTFNVDEKQLFNILYNNDAISITNLKLPLKVNVLGYIDMIRTLETDECYHKIFIITDTSIISSTSDTLRRNMNRLCKIFGDITAENNLNITIDKVVNNSKVRYITKVE